MVFVASGVSVMTRVFVIVGVIGVMVQVGGNEKIVAVAEGATVSVWLATALGVSTGRACSAWIPPGIK